MKKILFIEDEPALQRALTGVLHDMRYEVLSALDGNTGLRTAQSERPDLILLDLVLPQKDGFEVLAELRQDQRTAHIPVIVLTNLAETPDVERAIRMGASAYLIKTNYHLTEIVQKIEKALGQS